ncbi:MAG: FkbM family methyltransferase [Alphaproteobacteria bacterium]
MENLFRTLAVAGIADALPLRYVDIGSRGGFLDDLLPIAFAVDALGFEPDPVAYAMLDYAPAGPWRSATFLPYGVGAKTGSANLYVTTDPQSASLMRHDPEIGRKFDKPQFFELDRTEAVDVLSLEEALKQAKFDSADFLKIDIEGPELEVLEASSEAVRDLLCLKVEASFVPFRFDQPLAADLDRFIRAQGFELFDILGARHWRRFGYHIHPYYSREPVPYARGQIVQADYLYFRSVQSIGDDAARLIKLGLLYMAQGYFDHALLALERPTAAEMLYRDFDLSPIDAVAQASRKYGRRAFKAAAWRQFRGLIPFLRYHRNLFG